ncbi:IS30 family transposase [Candidatus Enterovibrio escicola]|uniref:IS30 family transposase n=1 Tax=Candidatus Enterovibrio escicola TaxID=1927127 RepID=UPI001CC2619C|nr:IS30 family transposase [Candidatus Enterovibrio escacola]
MYRYIWHDRGNGRALYKDLRHHGEPYKIKMNNSDKVKTNNRVGIEKRLNIVDEKTELGHLEIDTVVRTGHKSFLLIVVDKTNKLCCIGKMPNKQAGTVVEKFIDIVNSTFYDFKTLTLDNGT